MYSSYENLSEIIDLWALLRPRRILDAGAGNGTLASAIRQYERNLGLPMAALVLVESYEPFVQELRRKCLGSEHHTTIDRLLQHCRGRRIFDLALFVDVIEHMPKAQGHAVLAELLRVSRNVIVATPRWFWPQTGWSNPCEAHLCLWTRSDFRRYSPRLRRPSGCSHLYLLGEDAPTVRRTLLKRRLRRVLYTLRRRA